MKSKESAIIDELGFCFDCGSVITECQLIIKESAQIFVALTDPTHNNGLSGGVGLHFFTFPKAEAEVCLE